jgi:signal transduction histidine kinase
LDKSPDIMNNGSGQKISDKEKVFPESTKSDLLSIGIAHDLNNILATISGYAEMLHEDLSNDSRLSEKTGKILTAVSRARSLTDQMLAFSRHTKKTKISINPGEILEEAIDFVRPAFPADINIKSDNPGSGISLLADPVQLFRMFLNLITNAIQSMGEGGGTLYTSIRVLDGSKVKLLINRDIVADHYAVVTFKDTGSGMNASQIQKIFEPFFTTREAGKGTGLGLSVVREIVNDLKGDILVSSKENEGSVFEVYLPVSEGLAV